MRVANHSYPIKNTNVASSSFHHNSNSNSSHAFQAPPGFQSRTRATSPSASTNGHTNKSGTQQQRSGSPFMTSSATRPRRTSPSSSTVRRGDTTGNEKEDNAHLDETNTNRLNTVPFPRGGASAALRPWQQQQPVRDTAPQVTANSAALRRRDLSQATRQPTQEQAPTVARNGVPLARRKPGDPTPSQKKKPTTLTMHHPEDNGIIDLVPQKEEEEFYFANPQQNNMINHSVTATTSSFSLLSASDPVLRQYWPQFVLHGFDDIIILQSLSLEQFQGMCALCGVDKTGHQVYLRNLIMRGQERQSGNNRPHPPPTATMLSTPSSSLASSSAAAWPLSAAVIPHNTRTSAEEGGDHEPITNMSMVSRSSHDDVAAVRQALRQLSRAKSATVDVPPTPSQKEDMQDIAHTNNHTVRGDVEPIPSLVEQEAVGESADSTQQGNVVGVVETARARYLHPSSLALPSNEVHTGQRREVEDAPFTMHAPTFLQQAHVPPSRPNTVRPAAAWTAPTSTSFVMHSTDSSVHDVPAYRTMVDLLQRYLPEEPMLVPIPRTTSTQSTTHHHHPQRSSPHRQHRVKKHNQIQNGYQYPVVWGYQQEDGFNGAGPSSGTVVHSASKRTLSESMVEAARRRFVPSPSRSPSPPSVMAARHQHRSAGGRHSSPPPLSPYSMTDRPIN